MGTHYDFYVSHCTPHMLTSLRHIVGTEQLGKAYGKLDTMRSTDKVLQQYVNDMVHYSGNSL